MNREKILIFVVSFFVAVFFQLVKAGIPPVAIAADDTSLWQIGKEHGEVRFLAEAFPGALTIEGKGTGPTGSLSAKKEGKGLVLSGQLIFAPDSLNTGMELRDQHLKENYLEVQKHKEITFHLENLSLPPEALQQTDGGRFPFQGSLSLHGVKKPVTGTALIRGGQQGQLGVEASFSLKLEDYGIEVPQFAGITVANQVNVEVKFQTPAKGKNE